MQPITVSQAAETLGCTTSTIRRICIAHEIGALINTRLRLLSADDVAKLRLLIHSRPGNPGKKSKSQ